MNTEMRDELTLDVLDRVSGGMDAATNQALQNALIAIPVVGTVAQAIVDGVTGIKAGYDAIKKLV